MKDSYAVHAECLFMSKTVDLIDLSRYLYDITYYPLTYICTYLGIVRSNIGVKIESVLYD